MAARIHRARRTLRAAVAVLAVVSVLGVIGAGATATAWSLGLARAGSGRQSVEEGAPPAQCGELSRIRSVGAIGTQGAEDAVNLLTYPQRATAQVLTAVSGAPVPAARDDARDASALVDECATGWRAVSPLTLPVTFAVTIPREATHVQRFALWQDPAAPRSTWPLAFELLGSASDSGEDFIVLPLDRPALLRETTEAQWFSLVRPAVNPAHPPFPEVLPIKRLRLSILSTHGSPRRGSEAIGVSLGELAAYGPDLEIVIAGNETEGFTFTPGRISALAGQPKFVFFINYSITAIPHRIVTVGQRQNLDLRLEPNQSSAGQFVAGVPGRYAFYCAVPLSTHRDSLNGMLLVR